MRNKANPWWYTDEGNDEENKFFSHLYYSWAKEFYGATYCVPQSTHSQCPFIAEQLMGEIIEREVEQ